MLYNTGIHLYKAAVRAAALRNPKARLMVSGHRDVERTLRAKIAEAPGARWVWVHAASLGEFEQGRPLIERLRRERPDLKVLLTFFSPSGFEVRRNYPGADAVCYLPFDTPANARILVDIVKPVAAVFVKYEFWRNYLSALRRAGVPTYLISAIFRPSQIFFKPWGTIFRKMLRCYTRLYVQDERSRSLLASIGVTNVTVAGDTRFDRVTDIQRTVIDMPVIDALAQSTRHLLIAGSSWEPDEDIIIPWLKAHPEVKSVFAPHEFNPERLLKLRRKLGEDSCRLLSELEANPLIDPAGLSAIIVDSFGKLASIYRKGTLAYVGGGFGVGIHNLNEAAVYDLPVIFGPNHAKFKEASDLIACGGGFSVSSEADFDRTATRLISDPDALRSASRAAGDYIRRSVGATDIIYNDIFKNSPTL
nr:3-deoxy-D-manno-octulosonic acid transferase [Bacteroides sp.]